MLTDRERGRARQRTVVWMKAQVPKGRYEHTLPEVVKPSGLTRPKADQLLEGMVRDHEILVRLRGRVAFYALPGLKVKDTKA